MKKELEVIMLPTKEIPKYEETNYASGYVEHKGKLYLEGTLVNLFIVSDEEIKKGDWYLDGLTPIPYRSCADNSLPLWKKIIASTDMLGTNYNLAVESGVNYALPLIPQDFIKYFVEKQGNVKSVSIEMEEIKTGWLNDNDQMLEINTGRFQPKLTKDNEVIISLEEKSYTRDEVAILCKKYGEDCIKYINSQSDFIEGGFHKNWILQNL